jgi:hypothetical protein
MKKLLLLIISFFIVAVGYLQTDAFPTDPKGFQVEVEKFMRQNDSKEIKDFMKEFDTVWNDGPFAIYRDQVISFSNTMLKRKYRPETQFKTYYRAVMDFHKQGHPKSNFDGWMKGLEFILKKKSANYFMEYVEKSDFLFIENDLINLPGHRWYSETRDWKIDFTEKEEIIWSFPSNSLWCVGKQDTTKIENTGGVYYPHEERFIGKKGVVYWTRNKLKQEEVNAVLNNYNINIKRSTFIADSVMFTHKQFFPNPLMGRLEEKLTDVVGDKDYSYPKFDSYSKKFAIKNIFYNTDYEGGFSFYGKRFIAKGDSLDLASLKIYFEGKLLMKATSKNFSIEEDKVSALRASIYIYLGEDSIYHPGLEFKILKTDSVVSMLRYGDGTIETPFQDTYHDVELFFELLQWKMTNKFVKISSSLGANENVAKFRSFKFFNSMEYERMGGMDDVHPLILLQRCLKQRGDSSKTFTALEFAKFLKLDVSPTRQMLMRFSIAGLIAYDIDKEIGTITERFYHMINSASRATDYDVIEIKSSMPRNQANATLSLQDFRWDIVGVENVIISDSQQTEILPYGKAMTLKQDMDFTFDGKVFAGRFALYGHHWSFSYKNFKFKSPDIDSLKIIVQSFKKDAEGYSPDVIVQSRVEDLNGELFVDHPNNKSGLKRFREFPSFVSLKKSYVYYEKPYIERGVYKSNEFFFMLDPFKKDSLDEFKTRDLKFDGTFVSAGIFPDLREQLTVMPDYSLGFLRKIDQKGLKAYNGKGTYSDTLTLSNRGLRGAGKLDYLTATAKSRDFVFYPDSMNCLAYAFGIKKTKGGIETPDVKAKDVKIHWEPEKDEFEASETGSQFEMYEGEGAMNGTLTLTPNGLKGDGNYHFGQNADMKSDEFEFKSTTFHSDSSGFYLSDNPTQIGDTAQIAFKTDNVKGDVSYDDRQASLKSNSPNSYVEFPINRFKAYMDEMVWKMDSNKIDMNDKRVDEIGLRGALFVSTDKRLDSLAFVAPNADFIVNEHIIRCSGVKYIDVADSRIFPIDEKVVIQESAKIDPFIDAKIWVGKTDKIHVLEHANITIFTSHKYSGTAEYTYVNEIGTAQVIKLSSVDVDEKDITVGEGLVEQIADFTMSPVFGFKGNVHLYGKNRFLTFDGYTKVIHTCKVMKNDWCKFQAEIDPNNIMIPIPMSPENDKQETLYNGFLFASDSTGLYPAMMSAKHKAGSDIEVLGVGGYIYFEKKTQEFRIASKEKLQDAEVPGAYMSFNVNTCNSFGEGRMDMGKNLGQVDLACSGTITHKQSDDDVSLDLLFTVDFKMDPTMVNFMEGKIKTVTTTGADIQNPLIKRQITDLLDSGKADKLYESLNNEGKFKRVPNQLKKMLVLTDLHFVWNKKSKALFHNGTAGVMVFNGQQVNKSAQVLVEIDRKSKFDNFAIYLEFDETNWYYFEYKGANHTMSIYSGVKEFMDVFAAVEQTKRVFTQVGKDQYIIMNSSQSRVDKFKAKFGITD